MEAHEYAKFFPLITGDEFDALVQDIKEHGLLEPIVVLDNKIIDGRNRLRACEKAGIKPRFEQYQGNGILTYVISKNVKRRHLTISQLGVIALELEREFAKEATERRRAGTSSPAGESRKGYAVDLAGKALGISGNTVQRAKRVATQAPDLIPAIKRGEITATAAEEEVRMRLARSAVKRSVERKDKKAREDNPREVKQYLKNLQDFCTTARETVKVAAYGKFSPEAQRFTKRWHDSLRQLLDQIESKFESQT